MKTMNARKINADAMSIKKMVIAIGVAITMLLVGLSTTAHAEENVNWEFIWTIDGLFKECEILSFTHGGASLGIEGDIEIQKVVDNITPITMKCAMEETGNLTGSITISNTSGFVYTCKFDGGQITRDTVNVEELGDGNFRIVESITLHVKNERWISY